MCTWAESASAPSIGANRMSPIISISGLSKTYATGLSALKRVDLEIRHGEIFALLGPNGAGKTTLINIVCGIVTPSAGTVTVGGHDIVRDYRAARELIGLVPQELAITPFESVWQTVSFSRGLFGRPANAAYVEKVLKDVALWDRRKSKIVTLSGGMKRRVMIAKALVHEPQVLFLDEPTAGVDVELRQEMWQVVRTRRASPSRTCRPRRARWKTSSSTWCGNDRRTYERHSFRIALRRLDGDGPGMAKQADPLGGAVSTGRQPRHRLAHDAEPRSRRPG